MTRGHQRTQAELEARLRELDSALSQVTAMGGEAPADATQELVAIREELHRRFPKPAEDDPHEKAEYDRELEHFARTSKVGPSKLVK